MRSYLLPTILERSERVFSRAAAKRQLGLPEDCVMLLSVARAKKYRTIDGTNFAEIDLPLLARYPQLLLVVVGPGKAEDWSDAIRKSQHKLIVETELDDVSVYFQAADIYVDFFPFVSITSLLEAGSYGTPLVSRFPYSDDAEVPRRRYARLDRAADTRALARRVHGCSVLPGRKP